MSDLVPSSADVLFDDSSGSGFDSSSGNKVRARRKFRRFLPLIVIILLIVGVVAAVLASKTNFDLRQLAFGGFKTNQAGLQGAQMSLDQMAALESKKSVAAGLFVDLTKTYYDADVINISEPDFQVKGVAFQKFDPTIDKTLVYARLENLPLISQIPTIWLEDNSGRFISAGVGDVVIENDVPVGYFLTSLEGDASEYKTLHFSYDNKINQALPSSIYLSVDFRGSQP